MLLRDPAQPRSESVAEHGSDDHRLHPLGTVFTKRDGSEVGLGDDLRRLGVRRQHRREVLEAEGAIAVEHPCR